jgi:hypothetical protein
MTQVVEHLASECKTLGSVPATEKNHYGGYIYKRENLYEMEALFWECHCETHFCVLEWLFQNTCDFVCFLKEFFLTWKILCITHFLLITKGNVPLRQTKMGITSLAK